MNFKNILPRLGVILTIIVGLASCEEDFSTINTTIIQQNFTNPSIELPVKAYSKHLGGVQTSELLNYQLGIYNDPVFGKSTVNLLSQLTMAPESVNPQFGSCAVVDSVVLYIPFFSLSTVADEITTYELDSIYGNNPIDINVYESNLFLRDFDPTTNFEERQKYYSTLNPEESSGGSNIGDLIGSVTDFVATEDAIVLNDSVSLAPGLRIKLSNDFFEEKILNNEGEQSLANNNNFREFFRGIYFEVTSSTDDGNLFMFDIADTDNPEIGVKLYTSSKVLDDGETCENTTSEITQSETRFFFNGISVNTYKDPIDQLPLDIFTAVTNPDVENGEERLYIRGGEGIITLIDLFGTDILSNDMPGEIIVGQSDDEEDLEDLREEGWIINEANLIFYVDQDRVTGGPTEPERIIIYETNNNRLLADYSLDITSSNNPANAFIDHLGRLERGSDDDGDFYKIKITTHLSNLINRDSVNAPLAVIVSSNVTQADFQDLENPILLKEDATNPENNISLERVPATSVISPEGTVFHGNRSSDIEKRLKLQIFYTKPE